jgi:uncharacterized membrane protein YdjX (TVP38/TMEM64 family)
MNTRRLPRLVLVLSLTVAMAWTLLNRYRLDSESLQMYVQNLGAWAPIEAWRRVTGR